MPFWSSYWKSSPSLLGKGTINVLKNLEGGFVEAFQRRVTNDFFLAQYYWSTVSDTIYWIWKLGNSSVVVALYSILSFYGKFLSLQLEIPNYDVMLWLFRLYPEIGLYSVLPLGNKKWNWMLFYETRCGACLFFRTESS